MRSTSRPSGLKKLSRAGDAGGAAGGGDNDRGGGGATDGGDDGNDCGGNGDGDGGDAEGGGGDESEGGGEGDGEGGGEGFWTGTCGRNSLTFSSAMEGATLAPVAAALAAAVARTGVVARAGLARVKPPPPPPPPPMRCHGSALPPPVAHAFQGRLPPEKSSGRKAVSPSPPMASPTSSSIGSSTFRQPRQRAAGQKQRKQRAQRPGGGRRLTPPLPPPARARVRCRGASASASTARAVTASGSLRGLNSSHVSQVEKVLAWGGGRWVDAAGVGAGLGAGVARARAGEAWQAQGLRTRF